MGRHPALFCFFFSVILSCGVSCSISPHAFPGVGSSRAARVCIVSVGLPIVVQCTGTSLRVRCRATEISLLLYGDVVFGVGIACDVSNGGSHVHACVFLFADFFFVDSYLSVFLLFFCVLFAFSFRVVFRFVSFCCVFLFWSVLFSLPVVCCKPLRPAERQACLNRPFAFSRFWLLDQFWKTIMRCAGYDNYSSKLNVMTSH